MSWPPLVADEVQITNRSETLRRQISPKLLRDGVIGSDTFKPKDGKASTTMDSVLTPQQAHDGYPNDTIGSCVFAVEEIDDSGLRAIDDSALATVPYGHAYIDLRGLGRSARDNMAKKLKRIATSNGIWRPCV